LNFASQNDADIFARGITAAVNKLKQGASSGGAGAMAGLNLMSRDSANNGARPAVQRSSAGQGAQMRGGAQMMMTMPKDMGAAFDQQREADIAAFRQMSAARKAAPAPAPAPARAPPSPQLAPHNSGPPPVPTSSKKSPLSEDTSSYDNNNGYNGDDGYGGGGGGGGDSSTDYGGGDEGGGDGGDEEEFTDAEIEAWRDSVIEAVRGEIEMVKQELVEAVQQWFANGGGGGGGGGGDWNGGDGGGGW
jgi:hypothetical protein